MSRIAELEYEIELLLDRRTALEEAAKIADGANDRNIADEMLEASDATINEICALRRELDELRDIDAMRETRRDRARAAWRSL